MALSDFFLNPLGLAALASLLVLVALYLISRKPAQISLPTLQFLGQDPQRVGSRPRISRLRRSLLFLLQAFVLILVALLLATPYLLVDADANGDVSLVVDASASMATTDGQPRFARAVSAARSDVGTTTSVVVSDDTPHLAIERSDPPAVRAALGDLDLTDAPGDLASAVSIGASATSPGGTVHVYSDFADATDWRAAVETARAQGYRVVLHQIASGGTDNVGIVDLTFGRTTVTATVQNTGDRASTRTVSLGGQSRQVTLQPGDRTTVSFDVPAGGGQLRLSPGDSFPVDDVVPIAAPAEASIRVLLLTSEENRYLRTALSVVPEVRLRVEQLPAPVVGEFDVVIFSGVDPERVLAGNVVLARETLRAGGGVVITAQPDLARVGYGDLLPVEPRGMTTTNATPTVVADPLTAGIAFPPPGRHLDARLVAGQGQALVRTATGTPLVATASREGGRVLYYGYVDGNTGFPFDVGYPVFWKRALYYAAGRPSLEDMNRQTGDRLTFDAPTRVATPTGPITATSLPLQWTGRYEAPSGPLGVGLLSSSESAVTAEPVGGDSGGGTVVVAPTARPASRVLSLVPVAAGLAVVLVFGELVYLIYRGDL